MTSEENIKATHIMKNIIGRNCTGATFWQLLEHTNLKWQNILIQK